MLNKLKKNNKKGFTLVELIVVLVILAILAALLIPALTGYIDKAKEKQVIAETRQAVMAAQTLLDEKYAFIGEGKANEAGAITLDVGDVKELAEVPGTVSAISWTDDGKIKELTYENGKTCNYTKYLDETAGTLEPEPYKIQ